MSVKYKGFTIIESQGTTFGKPKFKKYGKEIDIQEYIEAGRDDTEIYPCLEKYGCLKPLERTPSEIYADCTEYNDLRSTIEKGRKLKEIWANMPNHIKNKFNNDPNEFIDRGMDWAKKEMDKQTAEQKKLETLKQQTGNTTQPTIPATNTTTTKGE